MSENVPRRAVRGRSSTVGEKVRSIIAFSVHGGASTAAPTVPAPYVEPPPLDIPTKAMSSHGDKAPDYLNPKFVGKLYENQCSQLGYHREEDSNVLDLLREYLKKRGELENEHLRNVEKLNRTYQQKCKFVAPLASFTTPSPDRNITATTALSTASSRRGTIGNSMRPASVIEPTGQIIQSVREKTGSFALLHKTASKTSLSALDTQSTMSNPFSVFQQVITESDLLVSMRMHSNEKILPQILDKLRDLSKDNAGRAKKLVDSFSKIQSELVDELVELNRSKRLFEEMYNLSLKMDVKSAKMRDVQQKLDQARDSYIIHYEIVRELHQNYYEDSLPAVLRQGMGDFHATMSSLLSSYYQIDSDCLKSASESTERLQLAISQLDVQSVVQKFMNDHKQAFSHTGLPELTLVDQTPAILRLVDRENHKFNPMQLLSSLETDAKHWISKKQKEIDGVKVLRESYWNNPSFGNVEQTHDAEVDAFKGYIQAKIGYIRVNAQCKLWGRTGIDAGFGENQPLFVVKDLKSLISATKRSETALLELVSKPRVPSGERAPSPDVKHIDNCRRAVAVYEYMARTESELSLQEYDDLIIVEDPKARDDGWVKCEKDGKIGIVPASFIKINGVAEVQSISEISKEPLNRMVRALFDYNTDVEGEISFKEGDMIQVISDIIDGDEQKNWLLGMSTVTGITGQFPRAYVDAA
eukprot:Partr_v1_DN27576_c3_g1_i1_m30435